MKGFKINNTQHSTLALYVIPSAIQTCTNYLAEYIKPIKPVVR